MHKWRPLQHASCALSLCFVFPIWKWGAKISRFGDIKEVWYKDRKMNIYKSGQVRACFCWITEKFQIIQLTISFYDNNFRVDFFQRRKFFHVYCRLFKRKVWTIFRGIIWIKIQISIASLEKLFRENSYQIEPGQLVSIAYKRGI